MKITVTKKKQIDVKLTNEQCEYILTKYLRDYYFKNLERIPDNFKMAFGDVHAYFKGDAIDALER